MRGEKCMWEHADRFAGLFTHLLERDECVYVCACVCALSRSDIKYSKQTIAIPSTHPMRFPMVLAGRRSPPG